METSLPALVLPWKSSGYLPTLNPARNLLGYKSLCVMCISLVHCPSVVPMGRLLYSLQAQGQAAPLSPELEEIIWLRASLSEVFRTQQYARWSSAFEFWWDVRMLLLHFSVYLLILHVQLHSSEFPLLIRAVELRTAMSEHCSTMGVLVHAINLARGRILGRSFTE